MSEIHILPESIAAEYAALKARAVEEQVLQRIWDYDERLWSDKPDEIINRLGWLHAPTNALRNLPEMMGLWSRVRVDEPQRVVLIGMGGSSLAPEVLMRVFGGADGHPTLSALDTTDPDAIRDLQAELTPRETLFIVSTKSGTTAETLSGFKFFYNWMVDELGAALAGQQFIAITDPGSKLEEIGSTLNFRKTFLNDPNVGGRYSALTYFGLAPAALLGIDLETLLHRAQASTTANGKDADPAESHALALGCVLAAAANAGRDKLTFLAPEALAPFGDWAEQLIAESTGKLGKGILPVVGEALGKPSAYGDDRIFVHFKLAGTGLPQGQIDALRDAGHPLIEIDLVDRFDLGEQFFLWEMATAVAGWGMGVHPFDQPNVESAKQRARAMIERYQQDGKLPEGDSQSLSADAVAAFVDQAEPGDYIALQAFVNPTAAASAALNDLRLALRARTGLATTVGFGPRFLHSTGQLHKGDGGNGLFIQITSTGQKALPIPDAAGEDGSSMDFGTLKHAQALGDAEALRSEGRRVLSIEITPDEIEQLSAIAEELHG